MDKYKVLAKDLRPMVSKFAPYSEIDIALYAEAEVTIKASYEKGIIDGQSKQAILEPQGRDKFFAETVNPKIQDLKATIRQQAEQIAARDKVIREMAVERKAIDGVIDRANRAIGAQDEQIAALTAERDTWKATAIFEAESWKEEAEKLTAEISDLQNATLVQARENEDLRAEVERLKEIDADYQKDVDTFNEVSMAYEKRFAESDALIQSLKGALEIQAREVERLRRELKEQDKIDVFTQEIYTDQRQQIAALRTRCEGYRVALDRLARLGNEPLLGNSIGNEIALTRRIQERGEGDHALSP